MLNAGADDCMTKPFVIEELLVRVQALLIRSVTRVRVHAKKERNSSEGTEQGQTWAVYVTVKWINPQRLRRCDVDPLQANDKYMTPLNHLLRDRRPEWYA